ncbi:MAG: sugar transporter family protein [Burkholderiales bacterium]|jgi:MHS family proline/betaine transporter-like MFS transporter|nr:sugar transporter family protein [Burkholderiales bacterium]
MIKLNRHLLQIGITSNILEWYEFMVYAYLANIIGQIFFHSASNVIGLIQAFAVFSISYLVRPIGSLYFGRIADRFHAGISLKYSLLFMSIPTFLIGMLPTYQSIGYTATFLLIILRIIQGFAAGGELPLSASYLYEISSDKAQRIFFCSLPYFGSGVGILAASLVIYLLYIFFSVPAITNWAWRLPFLCGLPLSLIILYIRKDIPGAKESIKPLTKIMHKRYFSKLLKGMVMVAFLEANVYILFVWMPTYLQDFLGITHINTMIINVCGLLVLTITVFFFSYIGQYTNYKRSYIISVTLLTSSLYPLLLLIQHINAFWVLLTIQLIFALLLGCVNGNTLFLVCDNLPPEIRNRGMGISITLPPAIVGGTAPLLCSYFIHVWHFNNFPGFYIVSLGILTLLVNFLL